MLLCEYASIVCCCVNMRCFRQETVCHQGRGTIPRNDQLVQQQDGRISGMYISMYISIYISTSAVSPAAAQSRSGYVYMLKAPY